VSWAAVLPAASALLGALLGSMTSVLVYRMQARLAEQERAGRRAAASRAERKEAVRAFISAGREVEALAEAREAHKEIDDDAVRHAVNLMWLAVTEVELFCADQTGRAAVQFTEDLRDTAFGRHPSEREVWQHLAESRVRFLKAARTELALSAPELDIEANG